MQDVLVGGSIILAIVIGYFVWAMFAIAADADDYYAEDRHSDYQPPVRTVVKSDHITTEE